MKKIAIVGANGFAKEVLLILERNNEKSKEWDILGFVDNDLPQNTMVLGYPVIGDDEWLIQYSEELYIVLGVGSPILKRKLINKYNQNSKIIFPNIIDNSVILSKHNVIGSGCVICASTIITVEVEIGDFVTINLDCTIGHNSIVDDFTTLSPSVNISGNVKVGKLVEVGTGAHFIPGVVVHDCAVIGAGSVVIKEVNSKCTVVGNPAKVIKQE